jgi:hypothetical protein
MVVFSPVSLFFEFANRIFFSPERSLILGSYLFLPLFGSWVYALHGLAFSYYFTSEYNDRVERRFQRIHHRKPRPLDYKDPFFIERISTVTMGAYLLTFPSFLWCENIIEFIFLVILYCVHIYTSHSISKKMGAELKEHVPVQKTSENPFWD